jgi:hypothetical protein
LDLAQFKSAVAHTLSYTSLGKNAIVEAELELKSYLATAETDAELDLYERMRPIKFGPALPLNMVVQQFRHRSDEYGALISPQSKITPTVPDKSTIVSSIVAMYITAIIEHIAEYILLGVARTCEAEDMEHVRIKEVYATLLEDSQVGSAFSRMELKTRLEKRIYPDGNAHSPTNGSLPGTPAKFSVPMSPTSTLNSEISIGFEGELEDYSVCMNIITRKLPLSPVKLNLSHFFAEYHNDHDREIDYDADQTSIRSDPAMIPRSESVQSTQRPSSRASQTTKAVQPASTVSYTYRPNSVLNQTSANGGGAGSLPSSPKAKTGFRLFGKKKKSQSKDIDSDMIGRATSPSPTIDDDDNKIMDFEALMLSGGTMKVTLTPNRLKSIEVNDKNGEQEKQQGAWRRKKPDIEIVPPPKIDLLKRVTLQNMAQNNMKEELPESNGRYPPSKENRAAPPVPPRKQKRWGDASSVPQVPSSMRNNVITAQHNGQLPSGTNTPASPTFSTRSMRTINSVASLPSESDGDEPNRRDSLMSQSSTLSSLIKSAPAPPANNTMPKIPLEPIRNTSQRSISTTKSEPERPSSPSHNFTTNENKSVQQKRPSMIIAPRSPRLAKNKTRNRTSMVIKVAGDEETDSFTSDPPVDSEEDDDDVGKEQPVNAFKATAHRTIFSSSVSMDNVSAKTVPSKRNGSRTTSKRMSLLSQQASPPTTDEVVQILAADLVSLRSKIATATSVDVAVSLFEHFLTSNGLPSKGTPAEQAAALETPSSAEEQKSLTSDNAVQTDPWEPVCDHEIVLSNTDVVTEEKVESLMISNPADYIQARIAPMVTVTDCDEMDAVERPLDLSEFDADSSDYSDIEDVIPMSRFSYPATYRKAQFMSAKEQQVFESEDEEWFLEDSDNDFEVDHVMPPADEQDASALEEQMTAEWLLG